MKSALAKSPSTQELALEKLFYFFLGLRKDEIRKRVDKLKNDYPDLESEQLARILIDAQTPLSFIGGSVLFLPAFLPGIGPALRLLGIAGGATVMMQMHLFMVLEIAMLFGHDIEERHRLRELTAVLAASGLGSASVVAYKKLALRPYFALLAGGSSLAVISKLIGESAIRYYRSRPALTA